MPYEFLSIDGRLNILGSELLLVGPDSGITDTSISAVTLLVLIYVCLSVPIWRLFLFGEVSETGIVNLDGIS